MQIFVCYRVFYRVVLHPPNWSTAICLLASSVSSFTSQPNWDGFAGSLPYKAQDD